MKPHTRPRRAGRLRLALLSLPFIASLGYGGTYTQNFETDPVNYAYAGNNGGTLLVGGQLRLTEKTIGSTLAGLRLPDLDPGKEVQEFTLQFDLTLATTGTPADGFAVNFGAISSNASDLSGGANTGEEGFNMANGLTVVFDTYDNGGSEAPAIDAKANGLIVRSIYMGASTSPGGLWNRAANAYPFDNIKRRVTIHWEVNTGLDVQITGSNGSVVDVMVDQPTPGFTPAPGNVFAWGARTGGAMEDLFLDNIAVTTVPVLPIDTGGPVISEFLAENKDTSQDEDCDSSDWLEIYNGQGATQSLAGWYLTDDPANLTKWPIPATVNLAAYQYFVIWADAKNRTTAPNYHTNFTLPSAGGYLALVRPNLTIASSHTYGPQAEDVSYGALGTTQTLGFLETPTPGFKNGGLQAAGPPTTEDAAFSRPGGLITPAQVTAGITLTLGAPVNPAAQARYTTDNSVPTATSPLYPAGGLPITASSNIRVRYFEPNRLPGPVSSRTFILLDSTLATNYRGTNQPFSSNLPIIVFNSFGINIDNAGGSPGLRPFRSTYALTLAPDPANGNKAVITGPVDMQNRGGTHVRGETSAGFAQRPYGWEIWDNEEKDKATSVLGWPAESDYVLISNYNDKAVIRNMLPFDTRLQTGGQGSAMKERYVEVFFKQDGYGPLTYNDYRGIYVLTEKIKRDKDRVDIDKLDPCDGVFTNNPAVDDVSEISGGYIIRKDKASPEPSITTTGGTIGGVGYPAQTLQMVEPSAPSVAQTNYIRGYMNRFEAALYNANFGDPVNGYAKYIDVQSFIDGHLWVEIFKQIDGYRLSTYMTKPRAGKLVYGPLWDYNLCMGNGSPAGGYGATLEKPDTWYYSQIGLGDYPYHPRLFLDPGFTQKYWDRYWELRRGIFSDANIIAAIDRHANNLKNASPLYTVTNGTGTWPNSVPSFESPIARHNARWQRLGIYDWPNATNPNLRTTWEKAIDWTTITASTDPFQSDNEIAFAKIWMIRRLKWMDDQSTSFASTVRNFKPPMLPQYGGIVNSGYTVQLADVNTNAATNTIYYTTNGTDPINGGGTSLAGTPSVLISETGQAQYICPRTDNGGSTLTAGPGAQQWTNLATPPNIANWSTGALGLGFDYNDSTPPLSTDVLFQPYIGTDVKNAMQPAGGTNIPGLYVRIPFTFDLSQINLLQSLTLNVRYDDTYICYLNGTEIVRKNLNPATTPTYNLASGVIHADTVAVVFEAVDITSYKNLLVNGTNILAFHAMNAINSTGSAHGKDFLFQPKLEARTISYPTLTSSTHIMSRIQDSTGAWSPLTDVNFIVNAVPASASNIVVSEINYNPVPPTAAETTASGANNANDFEFIEIMNISQGSVDLTNCAFDTGITFNWADAPTDKRTLGPGGRLLIVENPAAFAARYPGKTNFVAGAFSGNLSNGGEAIRLLAANATVIKSFTYDDVEPWPVDADLDLDVNNQVVRGGYSLVLNNPMSNPDHNVGTNWRSSATLGGQPGDADSNNYGGANLTDTDGDGVRDIVEYAIGSNGSEGAQSRLPALSWAPFDVNGTPETCLSLAFTRNLNADGFVIAPEVSSGLDAWSSGSVALVYVGTQNNGDGTATVTYRSTAPAATLPPRLFARLVVSQM